MALIDRFKANMMHGGARANQFKVTINLPAGVIDAAQLVSESQTGGGAWSSENASFRRQGLP